MLKVLNCRRSTVAIFGIAALTFLGAKNGLDVSWAIAACVGAVAGANSYQGSIEARAKQAIGGAGVGNAN